VSTLISLKFSYPLPLVLPGAAVSTKMLYSFPVDPKRNAQCRHKDPSLFCWHKGESSMSTLRPKSFSVNLKLYLQFQPKNTSQKHLSTNLGIWFRNYFNSGPEFWKESLISNISTLTWNWEFKNQFEILIRRFFIVQICLD